MVSNSTVVCKKGITIILCDWCKHYRVFHNYPRVIGTCTYFGIDVYSRGFGVLDIDERKKECPYFEEKE